MKKIKLLTLLWVILVAWTLVWCWDKDKDNNWDFIIEDITWENNAVIDYNDNLVDIASKCLTAEDAIWEAYNNTNSTTEDIMNAVDNTISICGSTSDEINKLWNREWDSSLKDAVLSIIEKEIAYYTEFKELLPYLEKWELNDEELEQYNTIYNKVETLDGELRDANDNLLIIQEQFAKNHWFELEEPAEWTTEWTWTAE